MGGSWKLGNSGLIETWIIILAVSYVQDIVKIPVSLNQLNMQHVNLLGQWR